MKYLLSLVIVLFCVTAQACQQPCRSFCNKEDRSSVMSSFRSNLVRLGDSIENTEAPVFGKLGDILPFAIVGFCLQKLPEQTMMVLGGLLLYVLFNSDTVRSVLHTQEKMRPVDNKSKQKVVSRAVRNAALTNDKRYAAYENNSAVLETEVSFDKEVTRDNDIIAENIVVSPNVVGDKEIVERDNAAPLVFIETSHPRRPFSFL